jgi:hypothetical protein
MYSLFVWYIFKTAAMKKKVTMDSKHTQNSFAPLFGIKFKKKKLFLL